MIKKKKKQKKQKIYYIFDGIFLFMILYFLYNGINGNNGLLNLIKINHETQKEKTYLASLKNTKNNLLIKNTGLYEETLDLDLLEEQAKSFLGYIGKNNEFVIFLNKNLN
jgi:cell division protein FtsB